jgi:hypothetical protein
MRKCIMKSHSVEELRDKHGLVEEFDALWKPYKDVHDMYNSWTVWN